MANYTSGAPVKGNLTLKATIRPISRFNEKELYQYNVQQTYGNTPRNQQFDPNRQYNNQYGRQYGSNYNNPQNYPYDPNRDYNDRSSSGNRFYDERVVEKHFTFVSHYSY